MTIGLPASGPVGDTEALKGNKSAGLPWDNRMKDGLSIST